MKILFTNTYYQKKVEYTSLISIVPPLDLAYAAAAVREIEGAHEIRIIDANAERYSMYDLSHRIREYAPDILVVTAPTHSINAARDIFESARDCDFITMLMGTHGTALPEETLRYIPALDIILLGESERILQRIIPRLETGSDIADIPGIAYRVKEHVAIQEKDCLDGPFDALPFPARDLLPNHKYASPFANRVTAIQTTRGCPGRCVFCDSHLLYGYNYRARNPHRVVDEIEQCFRDYSITYFAVLDHTFTAYSHYVIDICNEIIRRDLHHSITFVCNTRVDMLDDNVLRIMKQAGCLQIGIGIESGETDRLRQIHKNISQEQLKDAVQRIKKHGMLVMGYALIGFPHETIEDIRKTERIIFELNPHTLQLSFATPLPGTELYAACEKENRILSDNWDDFVFLRKSVIKNQHMGTEELEYRRQRILTRFYLRPSKLLEIIFFLLFRVRIHYISSLKAGLKIVTSLVFRK